MAITAGGSLNSVPDSQKATLSTHYIDLDGRNGEGWAQKYLPDIMEKEEEVLGSGHM